MTSSGTPEPITYRRLDPAGPDLNACSACGIAVAGDELDRHTGFHTALDEVLAEYVAHFAQLEQELMLIGSHLTRVMRGERVEPLGAATGFGAVVDEILDRFRTGEAVPPGCVRLTLEGPVDQVRPAADMLGDAMPALTQQGPIIRDTLPPVHERRTFVVDVDAIRTLVNRAHAARNGAGCGTLDLGNWRRRAEPDAERDVDQG